MNTIATRWLATAILPAAIFIGCSTDSTPIVLSPAKPESVGFSTERLKRIDRVVNEYIEQEKIPGATALIARKGRVVYHKGLGRSNIEENKMMEADDIFRIASMTKALTSVAVMMLYEEGHFLLDDPISDFIPEFKDPEVLVKLNEDLTYDSRPAKGEVTIRQLLTHTSGLCYPIFSPDVAALFRKHGIVDAWTRDNLILGDVMKALGPLPLMFDPGEKYRYGLNTDVLGYLVEVISGMSLDEFFSRRLFEPLGMKDAHFYLPEEKHDRLVPVYANTDDGLQLNDSILYDVPLMKGTYFSGGGGISCTILDYARFMQMMINGGSYNGHQILSRKTVDLMTMDQVGDLWDDADLGLGFSIVTEKNNHRILGSVGNYSWGGYFSTSYWMDPEEELIGLFFCQMHPMHHGEIHQKFHVLTYQALVGD
jgi:CubicO group peptidase (beta-lactamase class C family)